MTRIPPPPTKFGKPPAQMKPVRISRHLPAPPAWVFTAAQAKRTQQAPPPTPTRFGDKSQAQAKPAGGTALSGLAPPPTKYARNSPLQCKPGVAAAPSSVSRRPMTAGSAAGIAWRGVIQRAEMAEILYCQGCGKQMPSGEYGFYNKGCPGCGGFDFGPTPRQSSSASNPSTTAASGAQPEKESEEQIQLKKLRKAAWGRFVAWLKKSTMKSEKKNIKLSSDTKQKLNALINRLDIRFAQDVGINKTGYDAKTGQQMQDLSFATQDLMVYIFLECEETADVVEVLFNELKQLGTDQCNNEIAERMRSALRHA